jgi:hypothetical protein
MTKDITENRCECGHGKGFHVGKCREHGCPCSIFRPQENKADSPLTSFAAEKVKEFERSISVEGYVLAPIVKEALSTVFNERFNKNLDYDQWAGIRDYLDICAAKIAKKINEGNQYVVEDFKKTLFSLQESTLQKCVEVLEKREIPLLFDTLEVRLEEINQGKLATYDTAVGWNAAREKIQKLLSLPH